MSGLVRFARAALAGAFFFLYGFFGILGMPIILALPSSAVRKVIRSFYQSFVFLAGLTGLYRVRVRGEAPSFGRLTPRGRIIVANHVSLIDICVLMALLPESTAIAKPSTLRNPFLAAEVRKMFLVAGEDPRQLFESARQLLAKGVNLIVFPQGTRGGAKRGRGAARLALELKVPVLPIHLDYDPVVLAKHQSWWDMGTHTIHITVSPRPEIIPAGAPNHVNSAHLTEAFPL